jgi:hypothetical protein
MPQPLENQLCCPLAIGKPSGYWTVRRSRRFVYVASIGLPITNYFSPITSLSDIAFATSDHGRDSGLAVRLQDLFLILSQCIDLGLLSITAAFRAAGHLEKILGSGFEMIRISQCKSARVVGVYG